MASTFTLRLNGLEYEIEPRGHAILVNGQRFEPDVSGTTVKIGEIKHTVELDGSRAFVDGIAHDFEVEGLDPSRARGPVGGLAVSTNGALMAIMPGLIIKVLVSRGDRVEEGDVVVILSAGDAPRVGELLLADLKSRV